MNRALLDLNDSEIRCEYNGEVTLTPGYALLDGKEIITGDAARKRARLEPHNSFNRYWQQLDLTPLKRTPSRSTIRHNADLAFAQLQQIWREAGQPESLAFIVPASFDQRQLGILLALANALPCKVDGFVDAALAAVATTESHTDDVFHLDIQLHQIVLTTFQVTPTAVVRGGFELIPDIGLQAIFNRLARLVADTLIRQYRFDPLDNARYEQHLFDHVEAWTNLLRSQSEVALEFPSPTGNLSLALRRDAVKGVITELLKPLLKILQRPEISRGQLLWSERMGLITGHADNSLRGQMLDAESALTGCRDHFAGQLDRVQHRLISRLDRPAQSIAKATSPAATHLLWRDTAYDLNLRVSIVLKGSDLMVIQGRAPNAQAVIGWSDGQLQVEQMPESALSIHVPGKGATGQVVRVGDSQLRLIRVL